MSSPRPRPSSTEFRSSSPLGWATGASVLLHALVAAAILLRLGATMPAEPPPEPSIELRLIETQGVGPATPPSAPAAAAAQSDAAPAPPAPAPMPSEPVPKAAAEPAPEPLPLPPPAPPIRPQAARSSPSSPPAAAPPSATPPRPPELNLGGGDGTTNALASGRAILPAKVDQHWRNHAPVYPPAAAERGEQGAVMLLIHVGPDGSVTGTDVAETSGFLLLDRAARDAVRSWHFLPAVRDGRPIASEMPLRVLFQLN